MIREREVMDALPKRGFVRDYVEYAMNCTDANNAYHLAAALTALTQTVPLSYAVPFASPLHPNLFTMIVGDSSKSRKTTAMSIMQNIMREGIPGAIGEMPGSQEGLNEQLRSQQRQLILYTEFGEFLSKAEQGYMMPLKTAMTSLWDCLSADTEILTDTGWKGRGEVKVGDLVYSMNLQTEKLELVPVMDVGERPVRPDEKMVVVKSPTMSIRTTEGHRYYWRDRNWNMHETTGREFTSHCLGSYLPTVHVDSSANGLFTVTPVNYMDMGLATAQLVDPKPDEIVWCVTNRNGTLVTRTEGRVSILGNCTPIGRSLANSRRGAVTDPRLSLFCGVATSLLERHTDQADWTGGFIARFLTFHAEPERAFNAMPIPDTALRSQLVGRLTELSDPTVVPGVCKWLDQKGKKVWDDWMTELQPLQKSASPRAQAACSRVSSMVCKIALLLCWDSDLGRSGGQFHIGIDELESALKIGNLHVKSVLELGEMVTGTKDMRDRATVLRAIGAGTTPLGIILRKSEMLKKRAREIIESLVEERSIQTVQVGAETCYRRTPEQHQLLQQLAESLSEGYDPVTGEGTPVDTANLTKGAKIIQLLPRPIPTPLDIQRERMDEDEDMDIYDEDGNLIIR